MSLSVQKLAKLENRGAREVDARRFLNQDRDPEVKPHC